MVAEIAVAAEHGIGVVKVLELEHYHRSNSRTR